jgi:hypothetical protein
VIKISEAAKNAISFTAEETVARIYDVIAAAEGAVALDGWYGVDYAAVVEALKARGCTAEFVNVNTLFLDADAIAVYKQPFITDDPGFGYCNMDGSIIDIMDKEKVDYDTAWQRAARRSPELFK